MTANNVKKNQSTTAAAGGKAPAPESAPESTAESTAEAFGTMLERLKGAEVSRGRAVVAVCDFFSGATINGRTPSVSVSMLDLVHGQIKLAKLTKLSKVVGSLLTLAKAGVRMEIPTMNPADYM
jgi:hypothetical protein